MQVRNAKTLSQLSVMVANVLAAAVSAEACFALPDFALASAASIAITILLSLTSFSLLEESAFDAHSVMERAKIFRSSTRSDLPWRPKIHARQSRPPLKRPPPRC